jgi:hypothetical protein
MLYPEVFYDRDLNATSVYLGYKYFFIDKQHWCFDLHAKVEYAWGTVTDKVYYLFSDFESISPILGAEMSYKLNWFGFGVGLDFIVLNEKSVLNEHPLIFAPYISLQIHFD